MLACQLTQTLTSLQKIQYELTLEIEAEPPMPCHGLLSYKPARLVQSQASTCPTFGVHSKMGQTGLSKSFLTGSDTSSGLLTGKKGTTVPIRLEPMAAAP